MTSTQVEMRSGLSGSSETSHSRAVLSSLPVSTVLPSGLNATALTAP